VLSLGSHTPDWQTRIPTLPMHVETVEGVVGSGVPFASFGWHMPGAGATASHHWVALQSVSLKQPETQSPVVVLHTLPVWPAQSALVVHLPHAPAIGPERKQNGEPAGHGSCVVLPLSPVHATQVELPESQIGV